MCNELEVRKRAMLLYHGQHLSKTEICQQVERSRPWLDRWIDRYDPSDVDGSLQDHANGPKVGHSVWSAEIRQLVIEMRRMRSQGKQWRYAFVGAEAIHLELQALHSPEVPPVRTIHEWFVQAGLIGHKAQRPRNHVSKPIPLPKADAVNRVQQMDLVGPIYLEGSGTKYYLIVLRDRYSHRCAIDVLEGRGADGIVEFLVASWQWMGLPDYLQIDNALEFRGSNRYPRSFGRVVRVAVDLGVEPIFNPPHEPWRNGGVEWFNGFLRTRLLTIPFPDSAALRAETQHCQDTCNQTHRLQDHNALTPNELVALVNRRLPPTGYDRHRTKALPQDQGFVSFVRLVRKSGRITLGAGDRFMVDPELAYHYVLARVDLTKKLVTISHNDQKIRAYDFSSGTVGAWAGDTPDPGDPDDPIADAQTSDVT
jgi:hypothetical protein